MEKNTSTIYIVKHKEYNNPVPDGYEEIYVGNMYKGKSTGINLLNPYLNELTALYDIYKYSPSIIVGLCHYRRFFEYNGEILKVEDAEKILKDYDIIITNNVVFDKGIYEQLRLEMPNDKERDILDKYYNKLIEEEPQLETYFKEKEFAPKEMFVCHWRLIKDYCEWIFKLILPLTIEFKEYDSNIIQKRMLGHLVERLFYYWIWKNDNWRIYRMDYREI